MLDLVLKKFLHQYYRTFPISHLSTDPRCPSGTIGIRQYLSRALIAALFVCAFNGAALADDGKSKTIQVGSELDYPPYALVNEDGEADGFSVDLIKAVAGVMGIDITISVAPWNELKTQLEQGEIDLLPHVYYSQERDKLFDFSITHTSADAVIFARKGEQQNLTVNDLRQKTVIAMQSDWTHEYLVANDLIDKAVLVNTVPDALRLLSSGEHDVAFLPHLVGQLLIRDLKLTNIEIAGDLVPVGRGFAFAVHEGDFELLLRLNEGLAIVKAGGRYDEIYEKWFGVIDPKGVSRSTVIRYAAWTGAGVIILTALIFIWIITLRRTVAQQTAELRLARDNLELRVDERTEELRESEESLSNAQRIARLGNWDWNVKTGGLLWSDEIYRIFGQEPQSFKATYEVFLETIHPDDRQAVITAVEKALRNEAPYVIDHRIVLPDGRIRHVHEQGEVYFGEAGEPVRLLGTVYDITEQKQAEETIRQSEEKYRGIFNESIATIYVFDNKKNFIDTNQAGLDLLGYSREELLGMGISDVDADPVAVRPAHEELLSGDRLVNFEHRLVCKDGRIISVLNNSKPLTDANGNVIGMESTLIDITERKRAELQLIQSSKLATLGEVTTGMAHELNQPLNIIHMAAESTLEFAKDGNVPTEVLTNKLERILSQTDRASAIINHMRTFGRTDSGNQKVVDLKEAVQGAVGLVSEQLRLKNIDLTVSLPETCRKVMGSQLQLEQVILNLLTNARDAIKAKEDSGNEPQQITIDITDDMQSEEVNITVQDTGGGIPDEMLGRIFEPFFTTKEVGQGTGLGLSIGYGIINDMGGRIEAANVNDGARFTITLSAATET